VQLAFHGVQLATERDCDFLIALAFVDHESQLALARRETSEGGEFVA
jgi:hypothetical protein